MVSTGIIYNYICKIVVTIVRNSTDTDMLTFHKIYYLAFFLLASPATLSTSPSTPAPKHILFFGNSLTAGYGVNPNQAFPALIGHRIDSLHLPYQVTNAGLSGETSA